MMPGDHAGSARPCFPILTCTSFAAQAIISNPVFPHPPSKFKAPMHNATILSQLITALPALKDFHAPTCEPYNLLRLVARAEVEATFSSEKAEPRAFEPFGELIFPYTKMGAIDSLDLFGIDELVIFAFYWTNGGRYKKTLDMGANIGLHSIIMSRCGFQVTCFEPDPHHFSLLTRNLDGNHIENVTKVNAAVSIEEGTMEFVRVLGNTTGSHLSGSKTNLYGEVERFPVKVLPFAELIKGVDFVKMDVEGHEKVILTSTTKEQWLGLDMLAEIGSEENASAIFNHFTGIGINMFAQKSSWKKVQRLEEMPTSYHDGSLFISSKTEMPWGKPAVSMGNVAQGTGA
ncbi:MAG: FkbM family methyltransferase [Proteobacteria bacterium]|nr:FkbM family methyltransferase [Pseudomonadota bacterium]